MRLKRDILLTLGITSLVLIGLLVGSIYVTDLGQLLVWTKICIGVAVLGVAISFVIEFIKQWRSRK